MRFVKDPTLVNDELAKLKETDKEKYDQLGTDYYNEIRSYELDGYKLEDVIECLVQACEEWHPFLGQLVGSEIISKFIGLFLLKMHERSAALQNKALPDQPAETEENDKELTA